MKTLWVVSGGSEAVAGIQRARELGLHVVVSDLDPQAPGFAHACDHRLASTYDPEATAEAALAYHRGVRPVDGVLSIAADVPVTTARVAAALGLQGVGRDCARLASDKLAMKRRFRRDGIPVPWFESVNDAAQLQRLLGERAETLILKPVDSRGARGVLRLTPDVDPTWAFEHARGHSPSGRVMVETFLAGPQLSTESLLLDGVAHTPCLADRNYEHLERFAPHVIEDGGDLPSALPEGTQAAACRVVEAAARSLGIRNGVAKGDVVISGGEPYVIELAPRLSGGLLCTHEIPLASGVDFVGCAIRQALGESVDPGELVPRTRRFVCQRYLFPAPGRVTAIEGVASAARSDGVAHCDVRVAVDDIVAPIDSHPARAGVLIAVGDSREQARARAAAALARIRIETAPEAAAPR